MKNISAETVEMWIKLIAIGEHLSPGELRDLQEVALRGVVAPEARPSEKEQAAADILLALVALKFYKDTQGKDAYYEAKQPGLWALAKEFLERAMPKEYALVVDGIGKRLDMNPRRE